MEMMVAMGILIGGLTALIALLTVAVSTRYSSDARQEAVWLADRVFASLSQDALGNPWLDDEDPRAGALADRGPLPVPDNPGMTYSVHFDLSEARPDMVLAEIQVAWSEQGEGQVQVFRRLLTRQDPFLERARRLRADRQLPAIR